MTAMDGRADRVVHGPTQLHADATAPGHARAILAGLGAEVAPDAIEVAQLLLSEVATNVVRHTGCPSMEITVRVDDERLRVEVADCDGTHLPQVAQVDPLVPGGAGLHIVDRMSSGWGTDAEGHGKTVWFEVPLAG